MNIMTEWATRGPALPPVIPQENSTFHTVITAIIIIVALYLLFHHHHYRRNRRRGLSVWVSMRGPFGTRISKRF